MALQNEAEWLESRSSFVGFLIRSCAIYGLTYSLALRAYSFVGSLIRCAIESDDMRRVQKSTSGQQTMKKKREARMRKAAEASSDQDLGTTDEDHAVDKQ